MEARILWEGGAKTTCGGGEQNTAWGQPEI